MRSFVKWNLVVLAVAMSLAFATGAYADTLSWSFSDPVDSDVYGSGTITYDTSTTYKSPDNGNSGYYLVTGMSGNIYIDDIKGAISTLLSESNPDLLGTAGSDPYSGSLLYDNLINLIDPSSPYLDSYGVVFYLASFDDPNAYVYPFELCGPSTCFNGNKTALVLYYYPDVINGGSARGSYQVDFSVEATAVPEPSVLALLTLGLVG
jgi:hypothetical protein